ncbi:hypothetical protein GGP41_007814 [Bipolaris sorokiniana]|uniref:Uncharacterized protein n=1 Tax=Cochliobolus sativus TaxID=45130 RepID=A0A8H5ZLB4_COCSA|nr:hypothetical protein GGP41_007814 [Bipolaris sorokiniana]
MRAIKESRPKNREDFERPRSYSEEEKRLGVEIDIIPKIRKTIKELARMGMVAAGVFGVLTSNPLLAALLV